MTHHPQFSSLPERWSEIRDFPGYSVSDWGRVRNDQRSSFITPSYKSQGLPMVGLMTKHAETQRSIQCKRSLTLLVAEEFVQKPENRTGFDTPINLDGNRTNNHFTNLAWRPLWFARRYHIQFSDSHHTISNQIIDVETGEIYANSMSAAIHNGLLDSDIYLSIVNNTYVWPSGQVLREVVES